MTSWGKTEEQSVWPRDGREGLSDAGLPGKVTLKVLEDDGRVFLGTARVRHDGRGPSGEGT